jgi:Transposase IS66 family
MGSTTVSATVALFKVQASWSKAAFEVLVERWAGIVVSDGYGVYQHWVHGRQACLAHLLRRARGLAERKEPELATFGHRVLVEVQRLVHWAHAPPTAGEVQTWYARMVHLLSRHRHRRDEAGTLARTLERELGVLWTFVVEEGDEPMNNRAERALRFAVLWRKIMQGTYNAKGVAGSSASSRCGRRAVSEALPRSPFWLKRSPASLTASTQIPPGSNSSDPLNTYGSICPEKQHLQTFQRRSSGP